MLADLGHTVTTKDSLGDSDMDNFVFDLSEVGAIEADPMDIDETTVLDQHISDDVNAGLQTPTVDSVIELASSPNHHAITLQDSENDELVAEVPSNNEEVGGKLSTYSASDASDDAGDMEDQEKPEGVGSQLSEGTKPRLFPIEVILSPPADPDSYKILPPSLTVEKVLREAEQDGEVCYEVEFDDGRVDVVAYDELYELEHGNRSLNIFQRDQRLALEHSAIGPAAMERTFLEDEYSDSEDSDSDRPSKKRLRTRTPVRRSQRQTTSSRQASVDHRLDVGRDGFSDEDNNDRADLDDEDDEHFSLRPRGSRAATRTSKRVTRASNNTQPRITTAYAQLNSSEDELANESDNDTTFRPVVSDLGPTKRSSARKRKSVARYSRPQLRKDRDSSIEFETSTRRSGRTAAKNYAVPDVDDDYVVYEDKNDAVPKHVSVKEIFKPLDSESDFAKMHSHECSVCQGKANAGKGVLVYCQGCSYSFHKVCLGIRSQREHRVTKIGHDDFVLQCRICVGVHRKKDEGAPNHAMCRICKLSNPSCSEFSTKKTPKQEEKLREGNEGEDPVTPIDPKLVQNAESLLFRCSTCKRGIHFDHLPPLTKDGEIASDIRADRLDEYAMVDWKCKDCVESTNKIHALVAWRPVDESIYIEGQTYFQLTEDAKEYLVKWDGRSHFHDTWMPGAWVFGVAASAMRSAFAKRDGNHLPKMTTKDAVEEEWLLADVLLSVTYNKKSTNTHKAKDLARLSDIKEVHVKFQGLSYTEAVWDSPPPKDSGAPWEAFCAAYEEYIEGVYFPTITDNKMKERIQQYRSLDFKKECALKGGLQPPGLKRGKLMEYQMEGVNWLLFNFHQKRNVILADEMGLGKTVQVVALISSLVEDKPNCWPFLVVVPNSTCPNWRRELKQWAPGLRVVTYHGGKEAQQLAYKYELFPDGAQGGMKAHVVILSYEAAVEARTTFRNVNWAGLIVDEGQRLKNDESQLYLALQSMKIPFRLLLTGTPLQNNKRELFNLLQFIDPAHNAEELDAKFAELTKDNIPELHSMIRPYFLRRTKVQVLKFLPSMAQVILPVTMSVLQERLSRSIMSRNPDLIKAIISKSKVKAGERKSLNNILMELRRCLCHPFIFSSSVEDRSVTDAARIQANMVEASGKLLLLNVMLPKLKERGHRVLIFSQFLMSLTILEDFLTGLGLEHSRIDGSLSALEKQKRIDAYNAPDSPLFAMLLSTRAGGVGINLATADTVIIYDPDFNPHQDIQALSRAHRIGQKNKVLCFQLMTKNTVEEKIMQIGRKKMALDHALIESMDAGDDAGDDLESILKHGAQALFADEARDKIIYDDASVEKLLDRTQVETTDTGADESAEGQFSFARIWANDKGDLDANTNDADDVDSPAAESVWDNILKQREAEHQAEVAANQQTYGRGARRRTNKIYNLSVVSDFIEGVNDDLLMEKQQPQANDSGSDMEVDDELYIDGRVEESDEDEHMDVAHGTAPMLKGPKVPSLQMPVATPQLPQLPLPPSVPRPVKKAKVEAVPLGDAQPKKRGRPRKNPLPVDKGAQSKVLPNRPSPRQNIQPRPQQTSLYQQQPSMMTQQWQKMAIETRPPQVLNSNSQPPTYSHRMAIQLPSFPVPPPPSVQRAMEAQAMQSQAQGSMPILHSMVRQPPAQDAPRTQSHSQPPVLNSNAPAPQQAHTGFLDNGPTCLLCSGRQCSGNMSCVNFDSINSLRIAYDDLRRFKAPPEHLQAVRSRLSKRIKELQARKS